MKGKKKLFSSVFFSTLLSLIMFSLICLPYLPWPSKDYSPAELSANGNSDIQESDKFTIAVISEIQNKLYITYVIFPSDGSNIKVASLPSSVYLKYKDSIGDGRYFYDTGGAYNLCEALNSNNLTCDGYLYLNESSLCEIIDRLSGMKFDITSSDYGFETGKQTLMGNNSAKYIAGELSTVSDADYKAAYFIKEFCTQKLIKEYRYNLTEIYLLFANYGQCSISRQRFNKRLFPTLQKLKTSNSKVTLCRIEGVNEEQYFLPDMNSFYRLKSG